MFKWIALSFFFLSTLASAQEPSAQDLLVKLDDMRIGEQQVKVVTRVQLFEQGELTSSRDYLVYVGSDRRSLALFQSPKEKGQKVLMLDDQFWMFMPRSKRPIRITPMQKLLGEASTGDIASLRWAEDYQGAQPTLVELDGKQVWQAELTAARKGLSYAKVSLFSDQDTLEPIKAELFLASGKHAKTAQFYMSDVEGLRSVSAMDLIDRIQKDQLTKITYLNLEPVSIPDKWFNPSFLARNPKM